MSVSKVSLVQIHHQTNNRLLPVSAPRPFDQILGGDIGENGLLAW